MRRLLSMLFQQFNGLGTIKNDFMDAEALKRQFEPIDDIVCYECRQTKFSACLYLDGECPLNLL